MDNDAKACYDCIVMLLATIISGHFGIPKEARDLQARAIRQMQFHVKTALGISMEHYEDTETSPLHGSGQGSGSSAPLWLFISSIIMDCFEDIAHGMEMTNMDTTERLKQWIDGFVDDTSIFTSLKGKNLAPPTTAVAAQLQHDTQEWEKLLAMTGGKLELSKCFYYILQWKFDEEGKPTHTTKDELETMGVTIQVQEAGNVAPMTIKHMDCATAHRTLGLHKNPCLLYTSDAADE